MKTSENVKAISAALIKSHAEIDHAVKDAKNPHFGSGYASLESVIDASKPVLLKNEIIVLQSLGDKSLTTRLQHSSGEFFESEITLIVDKNNMQAMGSAITYARRYSLAAILNMSQADDDGNDAAKNPPKQQSTAEKNVASINQERKATGFDKLISNNPAPKVVAHVAKLASSNLGDYVIKFGKKHYNKKLRDLDPKELDGYLDYLDRGSKEKNQPLEGFALEMFNNGNAYLDSIADKKASVTPKLNEERMPY